MTERIPHGTSPGSWAEALIAEALARGELEPTAGRGRPLDLRDADDPDWWLKRKLREEEIAVLPPALQLRRDRDEVMASLDDLPTARAVRDVLEALDRRIRRANSHGLPGPPSTLAPLDVEATVVAWQGRHPERPLEPAPGRPATDDQADERSRRRWPWRSASRSNRR